MRWGNQWACTVFATRESGPTMARRKRGSVFAAAPDDCVGGWGALGWWAGCFGSTEASPSGRGKVVKIRSSKEGRRRQLPELQMPMSKKTVARGGKVKGRLKERNAPKEAQTRAAAGMLADTNGSGWIQGHHPANHGAENGEPTGEDAMTETDLTTPKGISVSSRGLLVSTSCTAQTLWIDD